uniref:RanBD1 domain-containing protein n=2 Tax=Rhodosorus marinus TaxID=101924 RepID=A0A7S3EA78_9RHOD|mmetsp:Transcript_17524/g.70953  ORF Transcript_17524/g.70953 Transcript_17524/m.70953 type:complete len:111 (+) Transcript_17524:526-858(+)
MRREKTLKICLNHYVNTDIELQENIGSERSWVWSAVDYADGERDECVLAIRFPNVEIAQEFRKEYDKARDYMKALLEEEDKKEDSKEDSKEEQKEKSEETKETAEEKKDE